MGKASRKRRLKPAPDTVPGPPAVKPGSPAPKSPFVPVPARRPFWNSPWFLPALLVLATFLAYQPVWHAGFIWDDDGYVTDNRTLRDFDGLKRIWFDPSANTQYYPLVYTSFWLEHHLWQLNSSGYHLVNILLHSFAALLLLRLLKKLAVPGAWLAAAVFALHPVNVESVAWITERKNVLCAVFFFASVLAWLRFESQTADKTLRRRWWFASLGLFAAALLSKTVACSLPVTLLLLGWWQRRRLAVRDLLPVAPFFIVGLALGLVTVWLEGHQVGASGGEWSLGPAGRCLVAARALCFYAGKLLWPADLIFNYPRWNIAPAVGWQWLFPAAALAVPAAFWLARKRLGRGPLVAVLFFGVTLFPALGFVNIYSMRYSFVEDHFQYLACVGPLALAAAGLVALSNRLPARLVLLKPAAAAALLLVLGALTWRQSRTYTDLETLWRTTIERNPGSWMAHSNLGSLCQPAGRLDEAMAHYQRVIDLRPDLALGYALMSSAMLQAGRTNEAVALGLKAVAVEPRSAMAHVRLGFAYMHEDRVQEAVPCFEKALEIFPNIAPAHTLLADVAFHDGHLDQAADHYRKALEIEPDAAPVHFNLALVLLQQGHALEARAEILKVRDLQQNYPVPRPILDAVGLP